MAMRQHLAGGGGTRAVRGDTSRAAHTIVTLFNAYQRPSVCFFKTLDAILVEVGGPFGLRLYDPANPIQCFDTITVANVAVGEQEIDVFGRIRLRILRPHRTGENATARTAALAQAGAFVTEVLDRLAAPEHGNRAPHMGDKLWQGFVEAIRVTAEATVTPVVSVPADFHAPYRPRLDSFFKRLDDFFSSRDYQFDARTFVVFSRTIADGRPQIRLRVLDSQPSQWGKLDTERGQSFSVADSGALKAHLVETFDPANWNIADSFCSGVSCWMDWPWDRVRAEVPVAQTRTVERLMCEVFGGADEALVVPVHVNGIPWLALAGIFLRSDTGEAAHAFYREYLPILVTKIRELVEQSYLEEVREVAASVLRTGETAPARLTQALAPLTDLFPFPPIIVTDDYKASTTSRHGVEHQLLEEAPITKALKDASAQVLEEQRERISSYVDIGHTLKNLVSGTGWAVAAQKAARVHRYLDQLLANDRDKAIVDIREALSYAERSLSLFWTVEGLGHFIRLVGAFKGVFEWEKFRDWIDTDLVSDGDDIINTYGASVAEITKIICFGWGLGQFTIAYSGKSREFNAADISNFSMDAMSFPPFRKKMDGAYIFIFCLLEPIVNAVRAVHALPGNSRFHRHPTALRIDVTRNQDAIRVVVTNISVSNLPEKLSGLESTKKMMRDVRIAEFCDRPSVTPLDDGMYEIANEIYLHPWRLAETILSKGDDGGIS